MTLTDHHWSTHPPPPPSSVTPPMIMDHHHHHQQQSSLDSCSSSPGQTSLTSSHSSTSYAMTDMTNHSSCSSESYMNSMCFLERKPYRPFRSNEEYLIAMKEDLAEWLNTLYGLDLNCENFLQRLETGVILCQHANSVLRKAREWRLLNTSATSTTVTATTNTSGYVSSSQSFASLPSSSSLSSFNGADNCMVSNGASTGNSDISILDRRELVPVKLNALPGTFQARDNVANFIEWCRKIQIHECLLFETEDLVGRKNEKSFVLCLLEVARYGAKFGVLAPTLVQFEQEIDREIENDQKQQQEQSTPKRVISQTNCRIRLPTKITGNTHQEQQQEDSSVCYEDDTPQQQITNNDLESLHEKVVNLLSRCTCPVQFYLEHLSEGKYRIGDTRTLIFVRILRNHVMVRVGGGWDTLEHYLEKHDPCRGRFGHRYNQSITRVSLNSGSNIHNRTPVSSSAVQVILDRSDNQSQQSPASVCRSVNLSPMSSRRSMAMTPTRIVTQHPQESSSINGVRRASTSSNDSHQTSSSTCSVQDYSIISTSSSTSLLPSGSLELCNNSTATSSNKTPSHNHHCHSMANFVYPDRNNNIKGLSANNNSLGLSNGNSSGSSFHISNSNNTSNKSKPQVAIKKRMNDTSVSTPCSTPNSTPTSRIPKSKFPITSSNHRSSLTSAVGVSTGQKTPITVLTQAHKLKSTSICSLAAGSASRIPTSSSSLSMDHRKLLTNYGLTPARYSSHNIYLECSSSNSNQQQQNQQPSGTRQNQPQRQIPKPPPPSTVAGKINRNHNHRYDKQKLNKSTFDLISSGRMNESSNSFYSIQMPMQQQYSSSANNNNNITNNKFSKNQPKFSSGNGGGAGRRPSSSSSTSSSGGGSLPRTKSTTIVNSSASSNTPHHHHFIKKSNKVSNGGHVGLQSKMTSSSLANVRVGVNSNNGNNHTKRLQGSATSLNSAGSTEGGTTTGSSNGSLNESSCSILGSISSSVCDGVDVSSSVRRLSSPLSSNNNKNDNLPSATKIMMKKLAKEESTTKSPSSMIAAVRDHHNAHKEGEKVLGRPIGIVNVSNNITNKPMVDVCSWMDRHKNQSAPSSHPNLDQ